MSQEQSRRPQEKRQWRRQQPRVEPIKYGDVFPVFGDLTSKPIALWDATMMQSAEAVVLEQQQRGGPMDAMWAAAKWNERAGLLGHGDLMDVAGKEGFTVGCTVTERVAGQGAMLKLPADRVANWEDAEWLANEELRTGDKMAAHPGGVAAFVAAAAAAAMRLNASTTNP